MLAHNSLLLMFRPPFFQSMKLNISFPATGCQKVIEIDDEIKLRHLYDKRMSHEIEGDILGDDFKVRRAQFDHDACV